MQSENEFAEDDVHKDIHLEYPVAEFLYRALRHEEKRLRIKIHRIEDHHELSWLAAESPQLEEKNCTRMEKSRSRRLRYTGISRTGSPEWRNPSAGMSSLRCLPRNCSRNPHEGVAE